MFTNVNSNPKSRRVVLSDHVYEALCEQIIAGNLTPGQRLREAQIAQSLGVSRTPVREAFAKLEAQNLLHKDASGAYYILHWDEKTLWEVATLRGVLEGLAIQLACPGFTPEDYDILNGIIHQMEAAKRRKDSDRLIALDIAFHRHIWSRCGHSLLWQTLEDMKARILYFMYTTRPGDEADYPITHHELVNLLKENNQSKANKTIQKHIHLSAERAITRLREALPSQTQSDD
ncbi:MAG: GntR family transcriptional regulator [Anaerolineaceae bacterium]|nr:GntR family transcriptional regulator [Anaerolineaceae bacterium]